jgi:hypothetical protein
LQAHHQILLEIKYGLKCVFLNTVENSVSAVVALYIIAGSPFELRCRFDRSTLMMISVAVMAEAIMTIASR